MKKRRLFVAIPLPGNVSNVLKNYYDEKVFPGRLTPFENLHVTVHFLGGVEESDLDHVITDIANAISSHSAFEMLFNGFQYKKGYNPMVWGTFQFSEDFKNLALDVKEALDAKDMRIKPHITFSRLKEMPEKELPVLEDAIPFKVDVVDLWESQLGGKAALYTCLRSFSLK